MLRTIVSLLGFIIVLYLGAVYLYLRNPGGLPEVTDVFKMENLDVVSQEMSPNGKKMAMIYRFNSGVLGFTAKFLYVGPTEEFSIDRNGFSSEQMMRLEWKSDKELFVICNTDSLTAGPGNIDGIAIKYKAESQP